MVAFPDPRPGLVISYAYLWHQEAAVGQEEGTKNRPCVILAAQKTDEVTSVIVLPITHSPQNVKSAIEIPPETKERLGLDDQRSWIITNDGNKFTWPGYDLRKIDHGPRAGEYAYGLIPQALFRRMRDQFLEHARAQNFSNVSRDVT